MTTAAATAAEPDTYEADAPQAIQALQERYERLQLTSVVPSKTNPRTHFDATYLAELAGSIREKGVVQPILVRQVDAGSHKPMKFEIIAGECRYRASKIAEQTHIPALIRQYTDGQVLELQLLENLHRKDLTPLEEAKGYRALITSNPDKHSAASIASRIGMSEAYVWDRLKLNDLIPEAKQILERQLMTVGHAILIARLKPEDQKRTVARSETGGYHSRIDGLWRDDHGFDFEEDGSRKKAVDKYDGLKACSVRELERWIHDHVRFDVAHAAKAQPFVFEETAAKVEHTAAEAGRGKKVIPITHEYRVADDARDDGERTYGSQAWERADGQEKSKTCEHSVLGVVVAGRGQGDTLKVCVARDKCRVHFGKVIAQKEKNQKLRESGQTTKAAKNEKKQAESWQEKQRRENAEQETREKAWMTIAEHVIADAIAQVKPIKALTPKLAALILKQEYALDSEVVMKHIGVQWFKQPVFALLVSAVGFFDYHGYNTKESGFAQYLREVAKPFNLDVKRLEAIRDKHAPKTEAAAAPAKAKKGKAKK